MHRTFLTAALVGLLALSLTALPAASHAGAIVVPGAKRCYVYETHGTTELWIESNGITSGGLPWGTGTTNHQVEALGLGGAWHQAFGTSGLQRGAGDWDGDGRIDPADTRSTDAAAWALACGIA